MTSRHIIEVVTAKGSREVLYFTTRHAALTTLNETARELSRSPYVRIESREGFAVFASASVTSIRYVSIQKRRDASRLFLSAEADIHAHIASAHVYGTAEAQADLAKEGGLPPGFGGVGQIIRLMTGDDDPDMNDLDPGPRKN